MATRNDIGDMNVWDLVFPPYGIYLVLGLTLIISLLASYVFWRILFHFKFKPVLKRIAVVLMFLAIFIIFFFLNLELLEILVCHKNLELLGFYCTLAWPNF